MAPAASTKLVRSVLNLSEGVLPLSVLRSFLVAPFLDSLTQRLFLSFSGDSFFPLLLCGLFLFVPCLDLRLSSGSLSQTCGDPCLSIQI